MTRTLTLRALNRTLLRRQMLDARVDRSVPDVVGRMLAVQAQEPNWVFVALWSRVTGFERADLETAAEERRVVRSPLLRGTQHLAAADDYRWLRPTIQPVLTRLTRAPYYAQQTAGLEPDRLVEAAREVLGSRTVPRKELGAALVERWPGRRGAVLAAAVEALMPVAHDPRTSAWGSWWSRRSIAVTDAEAWIGRPMTEPDVRALVRRYLQAFGPAGVMDVQAWTGLTRLREVLDEMRGELRSLRGPDDVELFDVPDGVLAEEDAPVPVRFLPMFDNAVLGHRDRTRILPAEHRGAVMPGYSMVHATVLVDGFAAAVWEIADGRLVIRPLESWSGDDRDAVVAEATRVAAFVELDPERVELR